MLSRGTFTLVNFTNSSQIQDSDIKTLFFEANKLHAGLNKDPRPCHHALMSRFKILRKKYTMLSRGTFTSVNFTNSSQIQDSDIKTRFFEANTLHAGLNKDPRQCHYALISRFRILPLLQLILPTVSYIQDNAIKTLFFEANKLLAGLNKSE